ncbi:MAG TPA: helix-turn-helix transcriptional regulator [Pseudonocardiaceae bacterium]|nr:helix-turn-helix transcriptional regulator [Pseudonocardiaceae bacterium]
MSGTNLLRQARLDRGMKQSQVVAKVRAIADRMDAGAMSASSLSVAISMWENGKRTPDAVYRKIFRELYGRTNEELGFPPDPVAEPLAEELADRLVVAQRVDAETVELFRQQTEMARRADRRLGSAARLDQLRGHIRELEHLMRHTIIRQHREQLAAALADALTLAGWDALDAGSVRQAWEHHEQAKTAARESGSAALLAHATGQQAFILMDIGEAADALALLQEAQAIAGDRVPRLLRAWLAAALGEGYATAGDRDGALRAFDQASALLPAETTHPELAFLFLGGSHLDRWRGNVLARLGEPGAVDQLTAVLAATPADFVRARAAVLVDLSYAHTRAGARDAARDFARQARRLVSQVGSVRQRRRLERLRLPGSVDL